MYDTILVPTDGNGPANRAVETALELGQHFDATTHAIYVMDLFEVPDSLAADAEPIFGEVGRAALDMATEAGESVGVPIHTELVPGTESIHAAIVDYAREHAIDLIVMGSMGRTGISRIMLGSVTERTLRHSPIPVLTIKEFPLSQDIKRVLVPTDGSEGAIAAANHAIEFAKVADASLHVVNAVDVAGLGGGELMTGSIYEEFEALGKQAVEDVISRAKDADLTSVEATVITGPAGRAICNYADKRNIDIIVIGTHGRSGLDRVLLGSVAEKVVRLAEMPVLTVNVRAVRG